MSKVLFTATVVKKHINVFHLPYLKMFKEKGWETNVAARNDFDNPEDCVIPHCDSYYDIPFERSPFRIGNIKAYIQLKKLIDEGEYDIIHCHTPVGALLTRLAAIKARKNGTKVFYTAHGFHFYKGAPLLNWLVYYPVERFLSQYTDVLITMNSEDLFHAKSFKAGRLEYVPGVGIDVAKFACTDCERKSVRNRLREQFGIPEDATVLLSVGEVNNNKNHKIVIECLPKLEDSVWYVICGVGPLMDSYRSLAEKIGVSERLILAGFRRDIADFYKMADIFVFPSKREGLPFSLMEAMASGLPVVCSNIRGNKDLVQSGVNGELSDLSIKSFLNCIQKLRDNPNIREKYSRYAATKVKTYGINSVISNMQSVYGLEDCVGT